MYINIYTDTYIYMHIQYVYIYTFLRTESAYKRIQIHIYLYIPYIKVFSILFQCFSSFANTY